jgi:hypothetical protein
VSCAWLQNCRSPTPGPRQAHQKRIRSITVSERLNALKMTQYMSLQARKVPERRSEEGRGSGGVNCRGDSADCNASSCSTDRCLTTA